MGRDRSTTDAAFGFQPWGPLLGANWYAVVTNNTVKLAIGDVVEHADTSYATPKRGNLTGVLHEETGASATIVGIVIALEDHLGAPINYLAASTTGNSTIAGYALVADHPDQLYVVAEDGDTSSIQAANIGLNIDAVGTGYNTSTYISTMEIDSNTVANTATLAFKIVGVHPDDSLSSAGAAGNHCRFIVKVNTAFKGTDIGGIA